MKLNFRKALNIYTDASADTITIPNSGDIKINLVSPGFLVFFGDNMVFKQHCIIIDDTTSVGEMKAIEMAIEWCKYIKNKYEFNKFNIFTDSESSILSIRNYMNKYIISDKNFNPNTRKDKHPGLIKLTDNVAYNIVSNDLHINFIFIPSHSRADVNIKAVTSKMKKKILVKNPNIESRMPNWKVYNMLVGNTAIDIFTRDYLFKYTDDVIKDLILNKDNIEFNIKREDILLWKPDDQKENYFSYQKNYLFEIQ